MIIQQKMDVLAIEVLAVNGFGGKCVRYAFLAGNVNVGGKSFGGKRYG